MKNKIFLLFLLIVMPLGAEIITCKRLSEITPHIDKETLVVFNINNVLTVSRQDAGSTPWAEEQIAKIMAEKKTSKPHATNLFIPLWHEILIASDVELFDPDAESYVANLQRQGIKVMALTNRYTEMAYPTHKNLRSVGIDFAKNSPYSEDTWIKGTDSPAKYVEGIIFNGLINFKGDTLAAFLKQIGCRPGKVIYVEDKPKHLAQVGEKVEALGIPFLGIHFGALDLERAAYRPELAEIQVKYHFDILDDASAIILRQGQKECKKSVPMEVSVSTKQMPSQSKQIAEITTIEQLEKLVKPGTLIVTELDHVLWETQGSIGSRNFLNYMREQNESIGDCPQAAKDKAERLFEKVQRRAVVRLIEKTAPGFIQKLKERHCDVIAITFRPKALLPRTYEQAESVGLNFSKGIIPFEELEGKLSKEMPKQILAVSCSVEDLLQLQDTAKRLKIPYQGRLFVGKRRPVYLDDELFALELRCLDSLLTNEEAALIK